MTTTITTINDGCATRRFPRTLHRNEETAERAPLTARVTHEVPGTGSLASGTGQGIKARIQWIRSYTKSMGR